jgi:solute carrier family 25 (adenine nucleotide translocator) protein 4/5/6/31
MSSDFLTDFLLGGIAGIIAKTVAAPLERVKLLLQTQDSNKLLKDKKYTGFLNCGKRILLEEGFLAYWRGNSANVIRYFPTSALNFAFKDFFNRNLNQYDPVKEKSNFMKWSIIAGGMSGTCTTLFIYPLDLARTRMGVDVGKTGQTQFGGLFNCIGTIFRTNGIRGLYNGLAISIPSIFLYRGLYFGFWDIGKSAIPDYDQRSFFTKFLLAQLVTMSSESISYPTDTIRRRMMMNSGLEKKIYTSTTHCIKSIISQEGWSAFFKGNLTNMMRGLSSSLVLVLYDELKKATKKTK